ncbi:hypothetical protein BDZ45DRAFT_797380 [Acephala macrosclerotiorum]|nr:hypothetical protein BDZ45DRAFT_797380 [Acephala macrosclerotiorum]
MRRLSPFWLLFFVFELAHGQALFSILQSTPGTLSTLNSFINMFKKRPAEQGSTPSQDVIGATITYHPLHGGFTTVLFSLKPQFVLTAGASPSDLSDVFNYHIAPNFLEYSTNLKIGMVLKTAQGSNNKITIQGNNTYACPRALENDVVRLIMMPPWSWGTDNEQLAKALEEHMKVAGNEEEKLQVCGGCKKAQYCSKACRKADWKKHKILCKFLGNGSSANAATSSASTALGAFEYYQRVAPNSPEAQELAREIGLKLPGPSVHPQGIMAPIRRLVITGKDTPENIPKFISRSDGGEVRQCHKDIRLEIHLQCPRGSPNFAVIVRGEYDENCPPWTPREACIEEARRTGEIRDVQEKIRRHMGNRNMSSINNKDMTDILVIKAFLLLESRTRCIIYILDGPFDSKSKDPGPVI